MIWNLLPWVSWFFMLYNIFAFYRSKKKKEYDNTLSIGLLLKKGQVEFHLNPKLLMKKDDTA